MELHATVFFPIEIVGTIAFASSGAMVAVRKKLDLFGIIVLGVITAVGGGMIRDLLIGNIPPNMFRDPVYVLTAFLTVLIMFLLFRFRPFLLESRYMDNYEKIMNILDAVGLGAFTVIGVDTGVNAGYSEYHFLIIFLDYISWRHYGNRRRHPAGYHGRGDSFCPEKACLCLRIYFRRLSVRHSSAIHPLGLCDAVRRLSGRRNPYAGQPLSVESAWY